MSFHSKHSGEQIDQAVDKIGSLQFNGEGLKETNSIVSLDVAKKNVLGGIKVGYLESEDNYAVRIDAEGNAYVHVPKNGMFVANNEEEMAAIAANPSNLGQVVKYVGVTGEYNQDSFYLVEEDD